MRLHPACKLALLLLCTTLVGCATSRSELKLTDPTADAPAPAVRKAQTVLIRAVTDQRVFEQAPKDPSIPSLGFEGAAQATAEVKARAIGRKRNTFGAALGDVLLENGQTVTGVVRDSLAAGLRQAGYRVTSNAAEAGPSPLVMDVAVKEFWAWFNPGFWSITLSTRITTDLVIQGGPPSMTVNVLAQDSRQAAFESAWIEIVDKALKEYRAQITAKAATLP
jgi:uncharacterized lipoprotein YajG